MRFCLFIFLSVFGSQVLSSESREELISKIEACGEVLGPLKRLGCFEQILEDEYAAKAEKSKAAEPESMSLVAGDSQATAAIDKRKSRVNSREQPEKEEIQPLDTTRNEFGSVSKDQETGFAFKIERVIKLSRGNHRLVFKDGQVWEEIEYDPRTRYKAGDSVIVRRGVLGTYNIISERTSRKNKVRRVK